MAVTSKAAGTGRRSRGTGRRPAARTGRRAPAPKVGGAPIRGPVPQDELGAHVSTAGGVENAPERARQVGSVCLQLFTKQPSRWAEPDITDERRVAFQAARDANRVRVCASHDAYLINLASPDPVLHERSYRSFEAELRRCTDLGLDFLVTHPGNATDGDYASGIRRNGESLARALDTIPGEVRVLLELTSGGGSTLGGSFEDLAAIIELIPSPLRARVGVCVDTCHAWSAGYDLEGEYEAVWREFDDRLGLERLRLFHFNDSKTPFASHRDRHEHIGKGSLGLEPFRKLLLDDRFREVPKLLETPKGRDSVKADRKNLRVLRDLRREG